MSTPNEDRDQVEGREEQIEETQGAQAAQAESKLEDLKPENTEELEAVKGGRMIW